MLRTFSTHRGHANPSIREKSNPQNSRLCCTPRGKVEKNIEPNPPILGFPVVS